ncbi:hypothetical protein [Streptomyces sp. NPDC002209]|uniref:hypothetical protein n=1 Tax=Streptomyces sp. NPDC002209 TaxID=3364638 RepID=UPI0036ABCDEC
MSSERVFVISPRKCGTHLVQELLVGLGYGVYGEPVPPSGGRPAFSLRERLAMAEQFLDPATVADSLFNPHSFTLNKGRTGRWRETFSPAHVERFESRFGHLLDSFGYPRRGAQ